MIEELVRLIENSDSIVALTGAGMSVECGIAPFRGEGGLWEKFNPEEYAHIRSYRNDPSKSWELFKLQIEEVTDAEPHAGYDVLVDLEEYGLDSVITQNVDGLHMRAGSKDVIELHGTLSKLKCDCGYKEDTSEYLDEILENKVPKCNCGSYLRPDVVMFGEPLPAHAVERALELSRNCGLMLVLGTSSVVYPAASLPVIAREHGAKIVEINPSRTTLTGTTAHLSVNGTALNVLKGMTELLGK